jgi:tRNA-specific 2-thiouridylase
MASRTAIALSGGIDSAVAALRLKAAGEEIFAIHFLTGFENPVFFTQQERDLRHLADRIGIALEIVDCREAFRHHIVDEFVESYRLGRTPNPCVRCNASIKFGLVLAHARSLGARRLATGHYVRLESDSEGRYHLCKGADPGKDQSYFLARLTQDQLRQAVFPLGAFTKARVQRLAAEAGLMVRPPRESQDVCFIAQGDYVAFLRGPGGIEERDGPIVDVSGRELGRHRGLHAFTIGQRRGIDCPGPVPYYVVRLDSAGNRLVVGTRSDLMASGCRVSAVHWIQPPSGAVPFQVDVRLRYRSPPQPARVILEDGSKATVFFDSPQAAVTPGQCAVFYRGEEVLGSGWIETPIPLE